MKERAAGKEVMVPLTSSLYIPGRIEDNNHILLEVGAGYFIEKDCTQAQEYCDRKTKSLTESTNKVSDLIQHKKMQMGKVQVEF